MITSVLAISQSSRGQPLEPAWEWTASAPLEWCQPVPPERPRCLLVATRDERLHQLQIVTGAERFVEIPKCQKGVCFAGCTGDAALVFGENEIAAFSIQDGDPTANAAAREFWRIRTVGAELPPRDGDPEFRLRTLAALTTARGVVVARSDGRIAELKRETGGVIWSAELGATSDVRLFGETGAVLALSRSGKGIAASFFDLSAAGPAPRTVDFSESWPMFAALSADGLIAAWPNRIMLLPPVGEPRRVKLALRVPLKTERLGVVPPPAKGLRPLLAVLDSGGVLSLNDLVSGEEVLNVKLKEPGDRELLVDGAHILAIGAGGQFTAFHRDAPGPVAQFSGPGGKRSWGARVASNAVFGLRTISSRNGEALQLVRTPLFKSESWSAERARELERIWPLGPAAGLRSTEWPVGRLVLVDSRRIRVYVLPTD